MNDQQKIQALNALIATSGWKVLMKELDREHDEVYSGLIETGIATLRDFDIWRGRMSIMRALKDLPKNMIESLSVTPEASTEGLLGDPFPVAQGTQNADVAV